VERLCPCGKDRVRPKQGYCRACHAACMRRNRPKQREYSDEQKRKANCRSYAHVYLKRGKLTREPCVSCGAERAEMHHADYSKPLEVTWLCRPCHLEHHREQEAREQQSA
jgi:hypothetical protein